MHHFLPARRCLKLRGAGEGEEGGAGCDGHAIDALGRRGNDRCDVSDEYCSTMVSRQTCLYATYARLSIILEYAPAGAG